MRRLLLLLLLTASAFGTAYNTQQSGNWNVASTWTTGACGTNTAPAVPGSGDTVTICAHTVTIPAGVTATVGASGATDTVAITMHNGTGILKNQGTLNLQGNIDWTLGQIILDQDSATVFVTPAGAQYRIRETAFGGGVTNLTVTGIAGHYATIDSSGLGSNGWLDIGGTSGIGVNVSASYLKINHCGDTTNGCLMAGGCGAFSCTTFAVDHLLMQNSGEISSAFSNPLATKTVNVNGVTIINPLAAAAIFQISDSTGTVPSGGGVCSVQNVAIYNNAATTAVRARGNSCTWESIVGYNWTLDGTVTPDNQTFNHLVMVIDDSTLAAAAGQFISLKPNCAVTIQNSLFYSDTTNPHIVAEGTGVGSCSSTANIIQSNFCSGNNHVGGDNGDFVLPSGTMTANNNVLINRCGTMFTTLQATEVLSMFNNTNYDNCGGTMGEGGTSAATVISRFQNNLIVKPSTLCDSYQDGFHYSANGPGVRQSWTTSPDYNGFYAMPGSGDTGAAASYATQGTAASDNLPNATLGTSNSYMGGPNKPLSAAFTGKTSTATTSTTQTTYATGGFTANVIAGDYVVRTTGGAVAPPYGLITSVPLDTQVNTATVSGMTTGQLFNIGQSYFSTASVVYGTTANRGTHDVHANPNFTNAAFTLATYNSQNGGAGTIASFGELVAQLNGWDKNGNAVTFNTAYTPATILLAGQTAFTPTNTSLARAGSDGSSIGAMGISTTQTQLGGAVKIGGGAIIK